MPDWFWWAVVVGLLFATNYRTWLDGQTTEQARCLTLIHDLEAYEISEETRMSLRILKEYVRSNNHYIPYSRNVLAEIPTPTKE